MKYWYKMRQLAKDRGEEHVFLKYWMTPKMVPPSPEEFDDDTTEEDEKEDDTTEEDKKNDE